MKYQKALDTIISRRKDRLAQAEIYYAQALSAYPELYAAELECRHQQLNAAKGQPNSLGEALSHRQAIANKLNISLAPPTPDCVKCGDTGFALGKVCTCVKSLAVKEDDELIGIPLTSFDASTVHSKPENILKIFCEKFPDTKLKNISLLGKPGTGKTFLASAVAHELINRDFGVAFLSAFDFNNRMLKFHTTFDTQKTSHIQPFLDCDILIIDDLGTESVFKNVTKEYLYLVLNERMNAKKHTMFTSNLNMDEIGVRYGERIASRMFDKSIAAIYELNGDDMRKIQFKK